MRLEGCLRLSALAIACVVALLVPARAQERRTPPLAALVSELTGTVTISAAAGGAPRAAQRFDALVPGDTLEVAPGAECLVVLAGGQRYELGSGARATLEATRFVRRGGPVTELPSLPTLPRLAALDASRPSGPPGGIRLRGDVIAGLRPSGIVTRAEQTTLAFQAVAGASRYRVVVDDEAGRQVFTSELTTTRIALPAEALAAGQTYYWTVETLDKAGSSARGSGRFTTLSRDAEQARQALRQALAGSGGADGVALLAEVDRRLGLSEEALEGFRQALAREPGDARLKQIVASLEESLGVVTR